MTQHPPSTPERFPKKARSAFETVFTGRRLPVSMIVLLTLAGAAYSAWWFWLADEARTRIAVWAEGQRAENRTVSYGNIAVSGFPGALLIHIDTLIIDHVPGGWALQLPGLDADLEPWNITALTGTLQGPIGFAVRRGPATGRYQLRMSQNRFRAAIGQLPSLDLTLGDVEIANFDTDATLKVDHLRAALARGTVPIFCALKVNAKGITLPGTFESPFGMIVQSLNARIEAIGAEPPTGLNARSLDAWRANGGALDVTNVSIIHGPLGLDGAGTLALDGALQPAGAFTAKIAGYNAAIDAFSNIGAIPRGNAQLAKMVLGALAKAPDGGGPKIIEVPLTAQDQQLSVGPVTLMRLPTIIWPDR